MTESEVLVSVMKRQIKRGNTKNLQHYTDVFLADGRISESDKNSIYSLLGIEPSVSDNEALEMLRLLNEVYNDENI